MTATAVFDLAAALALGPPPDGRLSTAVFEHGSLEVRFYAPPGEDRQTPHERDEVYVVASGSAEFTSPQGRQAVAAGALLFVAAGIEHRFEAMSGDFALWVLFYGPRGGESGR